MRTTLLFILLLMAQRAVSADADTVKLKVNYAAKCYLYEGQEQQKDDEMVLEVGHRYVYFYSRYSVEWRGRRCDGTDVAKSGGVASRPSARGNAFLPKGAEHFNV